MAKRRPIIGVVGSSDGKTLSTVTRQLANDIGRVIVDNGLILLTGGTAPVDPYKAMAVKEVAIGGALAGSDRANHAQVTGVFPKVIGVLPKKESERIRNQSRIAPEEWYVLNEGQGILYVLTSLKSAARNVINGSTPDVIIALEGGAGTLTEVGFALYHNRPVIFLNSFEHLGRAFADESADFDDKLQTAGCTYPAIDPKDVRGKLAALVCSRDGVLEADDPVEAVRLAMTLIPSPIIDRFLAVDGKTGKEPDFLHKLCRLSDL